MSGYVHPLCFQLQQGINSAPSLRARRPRMGPNRAAHWSQLRAICVPLWRHEDADEGVHRLVHAARDLRGRLDGRSVFLRVADIRTLEAEAPRGWDRRGEGAYGSPFVCEADCRRIRFQAFFAAGRLRDSDGDTGK